MELELLKFLAQLVIAVGSAFLAANLATRRFRKDKLWERKVTIYGELADALQEMKWPADELFAYASEGIEVPGDESERLSAQLKKAQRNVRRISERGSFSISKDVLTEIGKLEMAMANAARADNYEQCCADELSAIVACISRVNEIGLQDLLVEKA